MILVSIMGKYTPKNYMILFESAYKSKILLEEIEHTIAQGHFVITARVNGTWATLPKFLKTINKACEGGEGLAWTTIDTTPEEFIEDNQVYTEYNLSVEIPEPHTNSLADLIRYLVNAGCIVRKLYLKTHITPFTNSTVSSGCVEIAVPGTYKQAEKALEELALVAESSHIIVGLNLNLQ